jgi:4-amino-4-deoxy-L-arabinose transferase-like glycosyltransferase
MRNEVKDTLETPALSDGSAPTRVSRIPLAAFALAALLFMPCLSMTGLLGPDEPRYAAIGRRMAESGDWVTPVLWGAPWFEKPVLLYWMAALGFRSGLGQEMAPRLPVTLASCAFLVLYYWTLRREFSQTAAAFATTILATSAGWAAYSHLALTDLPMSAAFSAALLLALPWIARGEASRLWLSGAALGIAVLAKGLVPLVLALPMVWMGRRHLRQLAPAAIACVVIATPWYFLCALRNPGFLADFLGKHHVGRFADDTLKHEQAFWFYVPVFLASLFPWTPLAGAIRWRGIVSDRRRLLLAGTVLFGFAFFSLSRNKLPGYLLPLIPSACALVGLAYAEAGRRARWVLACASVLLAIVPAIAGVLPSALATGLSRSRLPEMNWLWLLPAAAIAAACWELERRGRRATAFALCATVAAGSLLYLKLTVFPLLDQRVSARSLWQQVDPVAHRVCVENMHRSWRYGLNYYSREPLPDCFTSPRALAIRQSPGEPPVLGTEPRPQGSGQKIRGPAQ